MRWQKLCILVAAISFLGGCTVNPSTGRLQLNMYSEAEVSAMGEQAVPDVIAEFGGEVPSQELRAYVRGIGTRLAEHVEPEYRDIEWEFFALNSDVINAFALPGGKIFITRGLLQRFENEAQVAGVLGHEIGHVTARHSNERLSQAALAQGLVGELSRAADSELVGLGASVLAQGVMLKYSRNHENEADMQGLKYMTAAGYDPLAMRQVLEILEESASGGRMPEFLSTHPYPQSRIERIDDMLSGPYQYTRGNPDYGQYRGRFQREAAPYL